MGFFHTQIGQQARKKSQATKRAAPGRMTESQAAMLTCQQCPLNHARIMTPKMKPIGASNARFYFLGDFPSKNDDATGTLFSGDAGALLHQRIPDDYADMVRFNNVLRCRTKADPAPLEIACCKRLQVQDIEERKPNIIIGLGQVPLTWMLGSDRLISVWRGRRVPVKIGSHTCWFYPINSPYDMLRLQDAKKLGEAHSAAFQRDLYRIFSDYEEGLPEPYVEDQKDYFAGIETLQEYGSAGVSFIEEVIYHFMDEDHAIDIETNGIRPYIKDSKILTIALGTYDRTIAFPWMHPEAKWSSSELKSIRKLLLHYFKGSGMKWAHGAKFEQEWFRYHLGPQVIFESKWGDTMAQAHVIDERKPPKSRGISLDSLTQLYMGFRVKDQSSVDLTRMETEPLRKILPYNGLDTKYTHALSVIQADVLEHEDLVHVYERFNGATPSLVEMQKKGVVRNLPAIETLNAELEAEGKKAQRKIDGDADVQAFIKAGNKFNPESVPNLTKFFGGHLGFKLSHTDDGESGFSVDEEALTGFKHPAAKAIIELRSVNKRAGYITPLREGGKYVYPDGLVHANYGNMITVSGRLACEDPNQQNYPRRGHKEIRRSVGCPPGHKFVAFDYGQLEARIIAAICNDVNLIEEIWLGQDIHGYWTDILGQEFVPAMLKATRKKVRDDIKQYWTFANFYGNTLGGLVYYLALQWNLDISNRKSIDRLTDRLRPFFDEFWVKYSGVKKYHETLLSNYWEKGYVETATGFRRHEPMALNEIINTPFQGTAGHLVIDAQVRCSERAYFDDRPSLQPIMNIHDDLSFYIPETTLEQDVEDIAKIMVDGSGHDFLSVPLAVEVSIGDNWCDKEEIATFTTDRKGNFYEVIKD